MTEQISICEPCAICKDSPQTEDRVNFCSDLKHISCKQCVVMYVSNIVSSAYKGTCPSLACPHTHTNKKKKILHYDKLKKVLPPETVLSYSGLAKSLLVFQCSNCHNPGSLDVLSAINNTRQTKIESERELKIESAREFVYSHIKKSEKWVKQLANFQSDLASYEHGEITTEDFYQKIITEYFTNITTTDDEIAFSTFENVLSIVVNPERRANLHLRYLRDRPKIKTICCQRIHCFQCRTKDFHNGKTCIEIAETQDHSVVECPTCNLALAKGDGCDTVNCPCGKQFAWSVEKQNSNNRNKFLSKFPENPNKSCAEILFSKDPNIDDLELAKFWKKRYAREIDIQLKEMFRKAYRSCPTQCCLTLDQSKLSVGAIVGLYAWKNDPVNVSEILRLQQEQDIAIRSLIITMYPLEFDRAIAVHKLLCFRHVMGDEQFNEKLRKSAELWKRENEKLYKENLELYDLHLAKQSLYLIGTKSIKNSSIIDAQNDFTPVTSWNRGISNEHLTFTNDDVTAKRISNASCKPASFAYLTSDKSYISIILDDLPTTNNAFSFGLVERSQFGSPRDNDVGDLTRTWGLRYNVSDKLARLGNSSYMTDIGISLSSGNVLFGKANLIEEWFELYVNDVLICKFDIPQSRGKHNEYCFAVTFSNDCQVSIIPNSSFLKHHTEFRKYYQNIRNCISNALHDNKNNIMLTTLFTEDKAEKWIAKCGSDEFAEKCYDLANIQYTNVNKEFCDVSVSSTLPFDLTYNDFIDAVSWYRVNKERILAIQNEQMALNFYAINEANDPACCAALNIHHGKTCVAESTAFMKMFCDIMHEWYDFDSLQREPLVSDVVRGCRCLPRHTGKQRCTV